MSGTPTQATRRNQSGVWRYFIRLSQNSSQCLMCNVVVAINCGSTTRMRAHIKRMHPEYDYETPIQNNSELPNVGNLPIVEPAQPSVDSPCTSSSQEYLLNEDPDNEFDPMNSLAIVHNDQSATSNDISAVSTLSVPKNRRSRDKSSLVWQYFDVDEHNHERVKCQLCGKSLAYCGSSTTGMRLHLERKHDLKDFHGPVKETAIPPAVRMSLQRNVLPQGFGRQYSITHLVGDMCITDLYPASIVEGEGFNRLISCLAPNVTLPSEKRITDYFINQYNIEKMALESDLATSLVTLSIEVWESFSKLFFATVTVHVVSDEWDVKSRVFCVTKVCSDVALIRSSLRDIISDTMKDISVVAITHNVRGLESLNEETQPFIFCFTTLLQECVVEGLKVDSVAALLQKAQSELMFFMRNNEAHRLLDEKKDELGIQEDNDSIGSINKWPGAYFTIDALIKLRPAIDSAYNELETAERELLIEDWCKLEMLQRVVKPLFDTTEIIASETFTSISSILPIVYSLKEVHLKVRNEDDPLSVKFKSAVLEKLKSSIIIDDPTSMLAVATFLDPQHKQLPFFNDAQRKQTQQHVIQLLSREPSIKGEETEEDNVNNPTSTTSDQPVTKRRKLGDKMKALLGGIYGYSEKMDSNENQAENEVFGYASEPLLILGSDSLGWWQKKRERYPLLCQVAVRHLSTSATACNSEYTLASNAEEMNRRRHMLPLDYLEELLICHQNNHTFNNMNSSLEDESDSMDNTINTSAFNRIPMLLKQEPKDSMDSAINTSAFGRIPMLLKQEAKVSPNTDSN